MLILVAVSISVALNTGLFKSAGDTTKNWKSAQDAEANVGSEIKIGDKTYGSIEDYLEGKEKLPEGAGKRFSETKEYTDGTKTAWIPAGFTVSGIRNETTIDGGLVIYDIPEGTDADWTNPDSVKTAYNQFVWIPVKVNKTIEPKDTETSIASFYRSEWENNERTTGLSTDYTEPYSNDEKDYDESTGIKKQIENLTKSIYKYGGFYIGRYEAGSETPRTSSSVDTVTTLGIKQGMYPYDYVKWGESMSNIGTVGAVALSNSLYNSTTKPNYGATSMLCTGACFDSVLDFVAGPIQTAQNKNIDFCNRSKYEHILGYWTTESYKDRRVVRDIMAYSELRRRDSLEPNDFWLNLGGDIGIPYVCSFLVVLSVV